MALDLPATSVGDMRQIAIIAPRHIGLLHLTPHPETLVGRCGGVVVDQHGRTDLPNLYAIGEVAYSGLHGANRLASNSLLECLVYANNAANKIISQLDRPIDIPKLPHWDESQVTDSDESIVISHNWDELRRFMWDYVGIVRTNKRLARAMHRIELLKQEVHEYYANYRISDDLIELRNLLHVAELIVRSAAMRYLRLFFAALRPNEFYY